MDRPSHAVTDRFNERLFFSQLAALVGHILKHILCLRRAIGIAHKDLARLPAPFGFIDSENEARLVFEVKGTFLAGAPSSDGQVPKIKGPVDTARHQSFADPLNAILGVKLAKLDAGLSRHLELPQESEAVLLRHSFTDQIVVQTPHQQLSAARACDDEALVIYHQGV